VLCTKFQLIWPDSFREDFLKWSITNKNCLWRPWKSCTYSAISEEKIYFRNFLTRSKNYIWRPGLLTVQDEMSNLYRGPSRDASYQVSVQLAKLFKRRRFGGNGPIKINNLIWRPCFLIDRDEMSILIEDLP
jgi:hypothetical protein